MSEKVITQILLDGVTTGIVKCSLDECVVSEIAYKIPRNKIKEIGMLENITRPGVYILFGNDENTGKKIAYIGKSTNIFNRLKEQNREKDFWAEAVAFVSKTNDLGETHIGYVEGKLYDIAKDVARYEVHNEQGINEKPASEAEKIVAKKLVNEIKLIVSMLGYRLFDEIVSKKETETRKEKILFLKNHGKIYAQGMMTNEGFVILKGSKLKEEISDYISPSLVKYVKRERESEDIVDNIFINNHVCSTPSMAAVLVLGRNSNGYREWKDKKGKTLKSILE